MSAAHALQLHRTELGLVMAAQAGEDGARAELIERFLPSIGGVAWIYRGSGGIDRSELMQEGVVGLLRALERYDPALGTPFWAYASWWVRQAMQQLVSKLGRPVALSDRALRQLARMKNARRAHVQRCGREPTPVELALESGLRRDQVENLIVAERRPRALEEPVRGADGDGTTTVGDLLADPVAEDAYERLAPRLDAADIRALLARLSDREREVVSRRYGLSGPELTLHELGVILGVSAERVRQVEKEALGKLRDAADLDDTRPEHVESVPHACVA